MSSRPRQTPFTGRAHELAVLRERVAAAGRGDGSIVFIAGEPGIGKTRIAREAAAIAGQHGALVLWGSCYEGAWSPPFGPWVEALGEQIRSLGDAQLRTRFGPAAPLIAQLIADAPAAPLEHMGAASPEQQRFRLYDAVARFLRTLAEAQPVVLVLDDLHWADRDSLALLRHVARTLGPLRVLLISTYRDQAVDALPALSDLLAALPRESEYETILLRGLSRPEVAAYLAEAAGQELPQALVRVIDAETAGNPFYLREVFRHLVEEGKIVRHAEGWSTDFSMAALGIPEGVRQIIGHRVARLADETQALLRLAAALPGGFPFPLLQALADLPEEALLAALDEALAAGLLRAVPGAGETYDFVHAIVRHALYDELSVSRRVRLHRRVGEALERLYAPDLEPHLAALAYHFRQAAPGGDVEKAIDYATRAGDQATRVLAHEEAAAQYESALEALAHQQPADPERRCTLLLALGEAQLRAGRRDAAKETFVQAAAVAGALGAAAPLAQAALAYGGTALTAAVVDPTLLALLQQARAALGEGDRPLKARVLARLSMEYYWSADADAERDAISQEAVAIARRLDDPAALALALTARRVALWAPEHVDERLALATEILQLAQRAGDRDLAVHGHHVRLVDLLELGEMTAVDEAMAAHARLAQELRDPLYLWHVLMWRAMRALLDGRLGEAETLIQQVRTEGQRVQAPNVLMVFGAQIVTLRREQGQLQELEPATAAFADQYPTMPSWRAVLALLYSDLEREADARREFERLAMQGFANVRRDGLWLITITVLAEVCAFLRDGRRAAILYDLLLPYARHTVVVNNGVVCTGPVARYLALLAAALGRWQEAAAHFEAALTTSARMGAQTYVAHAQYEYATMLLAQHAATCRGPDAVCGHWGRACDLLTAARATARELGLTRLEEKAARPRAGLDAAPRAGTDVPSATVASLPDGLTAREVEVLRLLAAGHTSKEIADALVLSVATVNRHLANIYLKIDARGRADAAAYAISRGLATPR